MEEWRSGGVFSATADAWEAGGFDVLLDGVGFLEVARRDDELDSVKRLQNVEQNLVFARPRRAAEKNAPRAYPFAEFLLLGLVAVRHVELEAPGDFDLLLRGACGFKARGVEIGLREDAREGREDVAEEPAPGPVARSAAVAHARIYEKDRYAVASRGPDEVRPYLAFGEDYRAGARGLEGALHEVGEVERIVNEDVAIGDLLFRHLPAGRARRGEDEPDGWLHPAPFAHELPRDLHFADGNCVHPDGPAFKKRTAHLLGIQREPVAHPRGVSAAPEHADEEAGEKKRIDGGEQQVIDNLLQHRASRRLRPRCSRGCSP